MKRRSFLTTAFAALGLGRVAAQASEAVPVAGVDLAAGGDKTSWSLYKVENDTATQLRTILVELKKHQDDSSARMRASIQDLHNLYSTP